MHTQPTSSIQQDSNSLGDEDILLNSRQVRESRGGCSNMTLWRHIKDQQFPPPDRIINGRRYWKRATVKRANMGVGSGSVEG